MADHHKSQMDIDEFFKNLFPENYKTEFLTQQYTDESNTMGSCQARIALSTKEDFLTWLKEHQQITGVTYRLRRTQCCKGKYSLYKADYRCHHNTLAHLNKSKQPAKKHTLCPANLSVTIKAVIENTRSTDPFLPHYPAIITINHTHNHDIYAMEAIRHKDPSEEVKHKFIELFKLSHTPSQALKLHKRNLLEEHKGNYSMVVADRSYCPDINWVFRLYHKYFAPKSRSKPSVAPNKPAEPSMRLENLENLKVNVQVKDVEENLSLASIIPMMEGGEEDISGAAEILFVDSMGNVIQKCKPSDLSDQIWLSYEEAQDRGGTEALIEKSIEEDEEDGPVEQAVEVLLKEEQELDDGERELQESEAQRQQGEEEGERQEEEQARQEEEEQQQEKEQKDGELGENVGYDVHRQRYHVALLENLFDNIVASVGQHYASYPDEFDSAIQSAYSAFEGIATESALIDALASFGKHSEEVAGSSADHDIQTNATFGKRKLSDDEITHFTKSLRANRGVSEHCYADMRPA